MAEQEEIKQNKTKRKNRNTISRSNAIVSGIKKKYELGNMTPSEIIAAYKQNDDRVLKALQALESKIVKPNPRGNISRAAINKIAKNKSKMQNMTELRQSLGDSVKDISNKKLAELVALDDWSSIFQAALPYILKFGAPYVHKLYNKYIQPHIGGDEGFNPIDWAGESMKPFRYSPAEGLNVFTPSTKMPGSFDSGPTDVSTHSIAVAICPEMYKHRLTSIGMYKSALGYITTQYSLTSNTAGNLGVIIRPDAILDTEFGRVFNDVTFDPATGSQTPSSSLINGPMMVVAGAIDQYRVVQISIEVQPSVSFNTPGMITMGYTTNLTPGTNAMGFNISDVRTFSFNTGGNIKCIYRMVMPYNSPNDLVFDKTSTRLLNEGFVVFATGLGSAITINLVVNTVIEFIPVRGYVAICPMQYPQSGPQTIQFMTQMFARYPVIQQLTSKDAARVASAVIRAGPNYNNLMNVIGQAIDGITLIEAPHAKIEPMLSLGNEGSIFAYE